MSAVDTALRIVRWAATGNGPLPSGGDARDAGSLANPPRAVTESLAQLTAASCASLSFPTPKKEQRREIGAGSALLATAVGVVQVPQLALVLLQAVPPPLSQIEWVTRHAIIMPALGQFGPVQDELADAFRLHSPLTAVLERPNSAQEIEAIGYSEDLIRIWRGGLARQLARPTHDRAVRDWRTRLLEQLRLDPAHKSFVLDVYEATMVHYEKEALEQIRRARGIFRGDAKTSASRVRTDSVKLNRLNGVHVQQFMNSGASDAPKVKAVQSPDNKENVEQSPPALPSNSEQIETPGEKLEADAISLARWWNPLRLLQRENINLLRARRYLGYGYFEGVELSRLASALPDAIS